MQECEMKYTFKWLLLWLFIILMIIIVIPKRGVTSRNWSLGREQ